MSTEIIRFIARPNPDREPTDFPTIAFRSVVLSEKSSAEDTNTAPCEHVPLAPDES